MGYRTYFSGEFSKQGKGAMTARTDEVYELLSGAALGMNSEAARFLFGALIQSVTDYDFEACIALTKQRFPELLDLRPVRTVVDIHGNLALHRAGDDDADLMPRDRKDRP